MNDAFIWRFFVYCCTPKALYNRGGSHLNSHQCAASTWMIVTAPTGLTTHQLQVERRESHTSYRWRERERDIETIKCLRSPHTSYKWRGEESHRANQVYALTTHQLQVERRESHRANQVYALTTHQLQVERRESHRANQVYALTTHQLQVERERES